MDGFVALALSVQIRSLISGLSWVLGALWALCSVLSRGEGIALQAVD